MKMGGGIAAYENLLFYRIKGQSTKPILILGSLFTYYSMVWL
jgi:hypothetical protein